MICPFWDMLDLSFHFSDIIAKFSRNFPPLISDVNKKRIVKSPEEQNGLTTGKSVNWNLCWNNNFHNLILVVLILDVMVDQNTDDDFKRLSRFLQHKGGLLWPILGCWSLYNRSLLQRCRVTRNVAREAGTHSKSTDKYRVFFFTGPPPKKLKYGKPRLGEVRCI